MSNDARTVYAELHQNDNGDFTAACEAGDWVTERGRADSLHDVVEEAGIHMDRMHP